jgi:Fe-S cluster assembly protein SufD
MIFINLNKEKKTRFNFTRPGKYVAFMHNLSGKFIFDIKTKNVDLDIYGLFVGHDQDKFEINTIQRHAAPRSSSNLLIKGVFENSSKFHHEGLIRIEKVAQKSKAYQKNQNLLLSPGTYAESEPFLEILANDVFCTHGSTTGKLNQDEVYYLKTRGIEQKQAEKLLVEGFINEVLNKVKDYI